MPYIYREREREGEREREKERERRSYDRYTVSLCTPIFDMTLCTCISFYRRIHLRITYISMPYVYAQRKKERERR